MQQRAKLRGIQLILVTVPDKSTVYSPWIRAGQWHAQPDDELFRLLEENLGASQNILPAFRLAAERITDFYRPDDTHLSLNGFRFLGAQIAQLVKPTQE